MGKSAGNRAFFRFGMEWGGTDRINKKNCAAGVKIGCAAIAGCIRNWYNSYDS